jgi:serine/threonine-protein kinase
VSGDGGPAVNAGIPQAGVVAVDGAGVVYIGPYAGTLGSHIRRVGLDGKISTIYTGDYLDGLVATPDGTLYFQTTANVVERMTPNGSVSAVGTLPEPSHTMALLPDGDLIVPEGTLHTVVEMDTTTGAVSTIAGTGTAGLSGEGGPALSAQLDFPMSVAVDPDGTIYVGEVAAPHVRVVRIDPTTGILTRLAGSLSSSSAPPYGDGGPAIEAPLSDVFGLAVGNDGSVFISQSSRIRRVAPNGVISTVVGSSDEVNTGDGGSATAAQIQAAAGLAVDPQGNLLIGEDSGSRGGDEVRRVAPPFA